MKISFLSIFDDLSAWLSELRQICQERGCTQISLWLKQLPRHKTLIIRGGSWVRKAEVSVGSACLNSWGEAYPLPHEH